MKNIILILSIASMAVSGLSARTIKSIFVQAPRNVPEFALLYPVSAEGEQKGGGEGVQVPLPKRNLSESIQLPAGDLTYAILTSPPIEGEKIPAGAQKVTIPAAWTSSVIIFVPDRKNEIFPGRAFVVNTSNANFPKGDKMIYNLSNVLFRGKLGKKSIVLKPRKSGVVKAPLPEAGVYDVVLDCVLPTKQVVTITRTRWPHNPNVRQILFVVPKQGQDKPRVWGVTDHREE